LTSIAAAVRSAFLSFFRVPVDATTYSSSAAGSVAAGAGSAATVATAGSFAAVGSAGAGQERG
jgi:hypothetical protein